MNTLKEYVTIPWFAVNYLVYKKLLKFFMAIMRGNKRYYLKARFNSPDYKQWLMTAYKGICARRGDPKYKLQTWITKAPYCGMHGDSSYPYLGEKIVVITFRDMPMNEQDIEIERYAMTYTHKGGDWKCYAPYKPLKIDKILFVYLITSDRALEEEIAKSAKP